MKPITKSSIIAAEEVRKCTVTDPNLPVPMFALCDLAKLLNINADDAVKYLGHEPFMTAWSFTTTLTNHADPVVDASDTIKLIIANTAFPSVAYKLIKGIFFN